MSAFQELEQKIGKGAVIDAVLATRVLDECKALLWQYRDDMRYPPAPDSRKRRIEAVDAVLGDK